jgi:lipid II:glycine glycyltransferase (peptidoglycan interpeptide bridge formation enzyme)
VRHAQRSGIVIRAGSTFEDARAFYELHVHTRKYKYHLLPQPLQFFHHLVEIFAPSDRILVLIAELNGKPVAGLLLLQWDNKLYYKFNASSSRHARPNELLIWHALLAGHERGLDRLDFGISDLDQPGLVAFKRKFATEERDVHFLEANPYGYRNEQGEQAQRLLGQLTRLLTLPSVPDEVTTAAGDELYRFFA